MHTSMSVKKKKNIYIYIFCNLRQMAATVQKSPKNLGWEEILMKWIMKNGVTNSVNNYYMN